MLLTALDAAPVEEGLLPVLAPLAHRHQVLLASVADPRVTAMAAGRGDAEPPSTTPPRPSAPAASGTGWPSCSAGAASRSSTRRPTTLPPTLADRYLALKAAGRL